MTTGRLNIWVTEIDDPCKISDRVWYFNVFTCDGEVLTWCGKKYLALKGDCGHIELEVPPGCYKVSAARDFYTSEGGIQLNHFTDSAVVQVRCGDDVCITLFNPSDHRCGRFFTEAVIDAINNNALPAAQAKPLLNALTELVKLLPAPDRKFELGVLAEINETIREERKPKADPK